MLFSFQRDIAARQVEARYRDEFVQDLITHNIRYREELLNRGLQFGWDLSGAVRCVIFDIDEYKRHFGRPMSKREARELEESRQRMSEAFGRSEEKQAQLRRIQLDPEVRARKSKSARDSEKAKEQRMRMYADPEVQERRRQSLLHSEKAKAQRARLHGRSP